MCVCVRVSVCVSVVSMYYLCHMADCQGVLQNTDLQTGGSDRQEVTWQVSLQLCSSALGSRGSSEGEIVWLPASLMPVILTTSA